MGYQKIPASRLARVAQALLKNHAFAAGRPIPTTWLYTHGHLGLSAPYCQDCLNALAARYPDQYQKCGPYRGRSIRRLAAPQPTIQIKATAPSQAESSSKEGGSTIFSPAQIREAAQKAFYTGCLMQIKRLAADGQLEAVIRYCDEAVAYAPVEA